MASQKEAELIDAAGNAAQASSNAALASSVVLQVLLAGSMSTVWAMINGLQIVEILLLFDVHTPGNVTTFIGFF